MMNYHPQNKMKCHYCPWGADTKDHVIPRSEARNVLNNKVPACKLCNTTRGNIPQKDYILFTKYITDHGFNSLHDLTRNQRCRFKERFFKETGIRIGFNYPSNIK